jgi:hypothetical protein
MQSTESVTKTPEAWNREMEACSVLQANKLVVHLVREIEDAWHIRSMFSTSMAGRRIQYHLYLGHADLDMCDWLLASIGKRKNMTKWLGDHHGSQHPAEVCGTPGL